MDSILPDRLLALVRPGNDLVLRRIRNLKRCVEACGCKIMTPRYACKMPRSCVSARRAKKAGKKRKPTRQSARSQPEASQKPAKPARSQPDSQPDKPATQPNPARSQPKASQKASRVSFEARLAETKAAARHFAKPHI